MIKALIACLSVSAFSLSAHSMIVKKVYDGKLVVCDLEESEAKVKWLAVINEIVGSNLVIKIVICEQNEWKPYVKGDLNGTSLIQDVVFMDIAIRKVFHHFSLLIASPDGVHFKKIPLSQLSKTGMATVPLSEIRNFMKQSRSPFLDLNLMSIRSTTTSDHYYSSEEVIWGQYRITP